MDRFMRQSEVLEAVGLSRQAIYEKRKAGTFPEPVDVGVAALRWRESEIKAWMESRPGYVPVPRR